MLGRVENKAKKKVLKKEKKNICLFVLKTYQNETHVSTSTFKGLFKNIVFIFVALVTKKLWAILDFFSKN